MGAVSHLEDESTLTDKYQTTVPATVRRALNLNKRDKIHYTIRDGEVVLSRAVTRRGGDPILGQFLTFLEQDIAKHPERLQSVDAQMMKRIQSLVGDMHVDLDSSLSDDDE